MIEAHGYSQPKLETEGAWHAVEYPGPHAELVLTWDVRERLFETHIVRRMPDGTFDLDSRDWLRPNEILAVRNARSRWVTADDFEGADEAGFEGLLAQEAANLRDYCGDVLDGDWSIQGEVLAWHDAESVRLGSLHGLLRPCDIPAHNPTRGQ